MAHALEAGSRRAQRRLRMQRSDSDAELSAHENHLMRKIADLLHITHGDYIAAKMRAREAG